MRSLGGVLEMITFGSSKPSIDLARELGNNGGAQDNVIFGVTKKKMYILVSNLSWFEVFLFHIPKGH